MDHLVDHLEAARATVVRVRYLVAVTGMIVFTEEMDFCFRARGIHHAVDILHILSIHRDYVVEVLQVLTRDLPRTALEVDAVFTRDHGRTSIRSLADMPGAGSRRVDFEAIVEACLANEMEEYPFGERRSANVAEADEENRRARGVGVVRIHGRGRSSIGGSRKSNTKLSFGRQVAVPGAGIQELSGAWLLSLRSSAPPAPLPSSCNRSGLGRNEITVGAPAGEDRSCLTTRCFLI